jgi:hypothetical protein
MEADFKAFLRECTFPTIAVDEKSKRIATAAKAAGAGTRLGSGTTAPLAGKSKKLDNAM